MKVEEIAKVAHQVNKAYCESLCDTSQVAWDDCPEWQKQSAVTGVILHTNNQTQELKQAMSHGWKKKVASSWVYGEKKDPDTIPPTHPCIVPFNKLPREQQAKDYIFRAVVHALV